MPLPCGARKWLAMVANMPATLDAAALCKMTDRGQITGAVLDGPLAFDNAISLAVARIKGIHSPVSGKADILVVPDLESYFCSVSLRRSNSVYEHSLDISNLSKGGNFLGARIQRPTILKKVKYALVSALGWRY